MQLVVAWLAAAGAVVGEASTTTVLEATVKSAEDRVTAALSAVDASMTEKETLEAKLT
jgi:hypothetical protein